MAATVLAAIASFLMITGRKDQKTIVGEVIIVVVQTGYFLFLMAEVHLLSWQCAVAVGRNSCVSFSANCYCTLPLYCCTFVSNLMFTLKVIRKG